MLNTGLAQTAAGSLAAWEFNSVWESWFMVSDGYICWVPKIGFAAPGTWRVSPRHLGAEAPYCSPCRLLKGIAKICDCKSPSFNGEEVEGWMWSHLEWAGLQIQYCWAAKGHTYWSLHKEVPLSLSLPSWIHIRSFDIVCTSTGLGVPGDWQLRSLPRIYVFYWLHEEMRQHFLLKSDTVPDGLSRVDPWAAWLRCQTFQLFVRPSSHLGNIPEIELFLFFRPSWWFLLYVVFWCIQVTHSWCLVFFFNLIINVFQMAGN